MAPAWRTEKVAESVFIRFAFPEVFTNFHPFMSDDVDGMKRFLNRLCDSIVRHFIGPLFGEGAEQAIPDNEDHTHVTIQVRDIAGVVNTVM